MDDDETLDQMGAGVRARYNSMATGGEAEGDDEIRGELSFTQQQQMGRLREESRHNDGNEALRGERERAAQQQQAQQVKLQQVQTKLQHAEARAAEASARAHQLETKAKQQERSLVITPTT